MKRYRDYEEVLRIRYYHLHGDKECSAWILQEKKKMLLKIMVTIIIFIILICNDISAGKLEYRNVLVNDKGEIVKVIRPEKGSDSYSFTTDVIIKSRDGLIEKQYYITIEPSGERESAQNEDLIQPPEKNEMETELKKLISGLNANTETAEIALPRKLDTGETIIWKKTEDTDVVVYFIGLLAVLWMIYHNRYQSISREEKRARESVIRELPEFINKLVLLINAGVILNTAFIKIVDACDEKRLNSSYFYRRIAGIGRMVEETNASFYQELYLFAKYSGVKELMRITNIMLDNISRGDDLADKMRRENELLWFARKQQAEEKGKLAETKLTMPLMILLTVLIMVTIAPALMEI